jgi:uncharacterized repeat protein (TIGR03803 family)
MALAILALVIVFPFCAIQAQAYSIIHNFGGGLSGAYPYDGLSMDRAGNLYGTTSSGGSANQGLVFKLSNHNGSWVFTPLYSFLGGNDGAEPYASVTIGADGNLYGTTLVGGLRTPECPGGCGTVYKLSPPARFCHSIDCPWTETVLYRFNESPTELNSPYGSVIFDATGNIYGTTSGGGTGGCPSPGCGAVYKLSPSGGGWTETTLYSFRGQGDGSTPFYCTLAMDRAGNLYGTTLYGSVEGGGYGTVFELLPSEGGWSEKTLYTFQGGSDGGNPQAGVILDNAGNLYGDTTEANNNPGRGVAFELSPSGSGWGYSVISGFSGSVAAPLSFDNAGNLYGTAAYGGAHGFGYVFELTEVGGVWTQTDLHDFTNQNHDGINPFSTVVFDAAGNLYGTTIAGGTVGAGVVWEITP